jgi:predicted DNA-binding transcriptional regulator AlpA
MQAALRSAGDAARDALIDRLHTGTLTKTDAAELADMLEAFRARKRRILEGWRTRSEVAAEMGVSVDTLGRWETAGTGPVCIRVGRDIRYKDEDVRAWLDEQAQYKRAARERRNGNSRGGRCQ